MNPYRDLDQIAIDNFRKYLRIPTVHPNVNYDECVKFLQGLANDLQLDCQVITIVPKKPIVVMTWIGKNANIPTILLNSHMDVVPAFEENWVHKPFSADIDEEGNIHARGAQDVKSLGIQYLEAIRRLKRFGYQPRRTIHVSFVPDEELGGTDGMKVFVKSEAFEKLRVGFAMDEGIPDEHEFWVYYGEKVSRRLSIHCTGQGGHGGLLLSNTAGEKMTNILKYCYNLREAENLKVGQTGEADDVVSINLTMMGGGVQANVIPSEFVLTFDARVPPGRDLQQFENTVREWCKRSGGGVWVEDFPVDDHAPSTQLDDSNPFWVAFGNVTTNMGVTVRKKVLNASSDARYLRSAGVPTIGFCPHPRTPNRAHKDNEFMNVTALIDGIEVFQKILPAIADV
ncbi:hypothetical protein PPYR_12084 [Photinus pyralis]|uniref:N-acyl-aliphatic-L-amino acid amidohydrolase n=1 Tax=Photinus pyralis TaxID=7054 RepID=A0A1Y1LJP4_PHOPY|nr:aminoacylase-1-like [Photinus pyralis]XP_031351415.1 aminoacylase-1-like [Photinus pyralis]KAB0795244.1 hypothetical protein PPYR_12083 [Photinus pyralis]KAB0795245.1 hypothetical protein PPYR_12084 [Photinus pyralis]